MIVLRESDFPAGWTSTPAAENTQPRTEQQQAFETCLGVDLSDAGDPADSPDFHKGDNTQASSTADFAPNQAALESDWAAVLRPQVLPCAAQQFDAQLDAQLADEVEFTPAEPEVLPFPHVGDGVKAVRLTTTVTAGDQQVDFFADIVFIRKGLAQISLFLLDSRQPFDAQLAAELARRMADRA